MRRVLAVAGKSLKTVAGETRKMEINVLTGTLLETNNYVIESQGQVVLIEASASLDSVKSLTENKKIVGILLTHGHWDHYLNIEKFAEEFKCPIYLTKEANEKINKKEKAFYADRNPKVDLSKYELNYIEDGDVLNFGNGLEFKVLKTSGHTNCCVCYLLSVNGENILFSGDTIFNNGIGRTDLPTGSHQQMKKSIEKILTLPEKTVVLSGHGEPSMLEVEKENLLKQI